MKDDDPDVRQQAIETLAKRRQASAYEAVESVAKLDKNRDTRVTAFRALPALNGRRAVAVLRAIAADATEPLYLRTEAADALSKVGTSQAFEAMIELWKLDRHDAGNRILQGKIVFSFKAVGPRATPALLNALHNDTPSVRGNAAMALGMIGSISSLEPISELQDDPSLFVRANAQDAVRRLRTQ